MRYKQIIIFTLAIFMLFMTLSPLICMATQVTPTYRWSPARPEKVIQQFFEAHTANDYCTIKELMIKFSRKLHLPLGGDVSVVGWMDYTPERYLYIKEAKLINIIKLDIYSDPEQNLECYQVVGDFKFKPFAPFPDGPRTFFVYLQRDEKDVWRMYAPEYFEWGCQTNHHQEYPEEIWP